MIQRLFESIKIRIPIKARRRIRTFLPQRRVEVRRLDATKTSIPKSLLHSVQQATFRYEYDGVSCIKNPFDLALYTLLLSELRPRTIVEIGSSSGGSAKWLDAQARGLSLNAKVFSFDVKPIVGHNTDSLTFDFADIYKLSESKLPEILPHCERPLLVVEDGPHTFMGCAAALFFFHDYLSSGDYIVIEDGILQDLGAYFLHDGPNRAVRAFLETYPSLYEVDRRYCDFFGYNATWNPNGYLRKL